MARAKIKRLPVVDEQDILQGIVSRADLLKVFLRDDEEIAEEVRREVVAYLLPAPSSAIRVDVHDGVVKLVGRVRDTALIPVAARLVRAVEGVVDTDFEPSGARVRRRRRRPRQRRPARVLSPCRREAHGTRGQPAMTMGPVRAHAQARWGRSALVRPAPASDDRAHGPPVARTPPGNEGPS